VEGSVSGLDSGNGNGNAVGGGGGMGMDFGVDGDSALSGTSPDSELVTPMSSELGDSGYRLEQSDFEKVGYGQRGGDLTRFHGGHGNGNGNGNGVLHNGSPLATSKSNFLGSTSYSSVFANTSLGEWQSPLSNLDNAETVSLDPDQVNKGARLLELFSRIPDMEDSIKRFYKTR
jgi:hypothetical protein